VSYSRNLYTRKEAEKLTSFLLPRLSMLGTRRRGKERAKRRLAFSLHRARKGEGRALQYLAPSKLSP